MALRHYVLIAQSSRRVEVYSRDGEDWTLRILRPPDPVKLAAIAVELSFDEIYEDSGA